MSIASRTQNYGVASYTETLDAYGQHRKPSRATRYVDMDIEIMSHQINEAPIYNDVEYIGLTKDTLTTKDYVFYGTEVLKVLFVNGKGRLNQVFMQKVK